jgi:hypothetical protein
MIRACVFVIASLLVAPLALAHHGGGTFDNSREIVLEGVLTKLDLINPHSWIYLDVTGEDGTVRNHRCEMRAATVLRRSGWRPEMFPVGMRVTIEGSPDRNDPTSCYLNTIILENGQRADRYGQFSKAPVVAAPRPARRPNGDLNISGDWAPEQLVMTDPRGRGGALVPLSTVDEFEPGEGRIGGFPGTGRGSGPRTIRGATLTPAGEQAASEFGVFDREDNPRLRCETTSIIFDWTFDGPVNRITQRDGTIVLQYGQLGFTRTVYMNMTEHPANSVPRLRGHSIGRWENDVLVVDSVGFAPGVLSPPLLNSDQLHVVERFALDTDAMEITRSYEAEDPVYFTGKYSASDTVGVADLPYSPDPCNELGYIDYSQQQPERQPEVVRPRWKFWGHEE